MGTDERRGSNGEQIEFPVRDKTAKAVSIDPQRRRKLEAIMSGNSEGGVDAKVSTRASRK